MLRLALLLLALIAAPAHASPTQESTFQDDNKIVYATHGELERTLDTLAGLGADRIRVTVLWRIVAPSPDARARPDFDARDPAAYPAGAWERFDTIVREAHERGLGVNFNLTAPAPLWAVGRGPRADLERVHEPDPGEFADFVAAAGRRYSGTYTTPLGVVPRVDYWTIWNEPNQGAWLAPQWTRRGKGSFYERSPVIYRALLDGAARALEATGHGEDTVLFGETASSGVSRKGMSRAIRPLRFLRVLYCVDERGRGLTGARAERYACPRSGDRETFRAAHPALFGLTGYAHHPYTLLLRPGVASRHPDDVGLSDVGRLEKFLDGALAGAGVDRRLPLYMTEFGYQTNPPDPFTGVSWRAQQAYLDHSEWIAYRSPRVRTLAQFLLVDDRPIGNFQSGLVDPDGRRKPAFKTYRLPVHISDRTKPRGRAFRVWALLRTAPAGTTPRAHIQFRPRGGGRYRTIADVDVTNPRGYLDARVVAPGSGWLRVAYRKPGTPRPTLSRGVRVSVR